MSVVEGIISDLSWDDCGTFSQVDRASVERWLNEARCLIQSLNPDFYGEIKRFKLNAGSLQTFCECAQLTKYIGQVDENCAIIGEEKFPQVWGSGACYDNTGSEFLITDVDLDVDTMIVVPPVPEGTEVYVLVKCAPVLSDASDEADLSSCRDSAALAQWALYRGFMSEADGEGASLQQAQIHLRAFADLARLQFEAIQSYLAKIDDDD